MPERSTRQRRPFSWYLRAATGRHFLEIKSLALLAAPVSFSTSLFTWESSSAFEIWARVLGNLLGFAAVTMLVALLRLLPTGRSSYLRVRLVVVLIVSAVLGFTKALVTNALAGAVLGQVVQQEILARGLLGAVAGAVLLPVTAIVSATLREYGAERELLLLTAYTHKFDSLASRRELANLRHIRSEVDRMRQELRSLGNEEIPSTEIALLRELVEKRVRPLSHSLYANLEKTHPSFELFSILRLALRKPPPGIWVASVHVVAIPYTVTLIGWQLGLVHAAISMLLLVALFTLGFRITESLNLLNPFTFAVQASLSGYVAITISNLVTNAQSITSTSLDLAGALWYLNTAVLFAGASFATGVAEKNRRDLRTLTREGKDAPISLENSRREFANQLHGEVQSRMLTLLLKAESDPGLQKDMAVRELDTVAELLSRKSTSELVNLESGLRKLRKQWAGILDLNLDVAESVQRHESSELLLSVIEQAVVNASRHGLADQVNVSIIEVGDRLHLLVEDNGIGPVGGIPGLGTQLFSSLSKDWSLSLGSNGGSVLRLEL